MSKRSNYGCGSTLAHPETIRGLARRAADHSGRGSVTERRAATALGHLARHLAQHGIKDLRRAGRGHIEALCESWRKERDEGRLSRSAVTNYASALNGVFAAVERGDLRIDLAAEGLQRGRPYTNEDRAAAAGARDALVSWLELRAEIAYSREDRLMLEGAIHAVRLQEAAGLRLRESGNLKILEKEPRDGCIALGRTDGPKNGRPREALLYDPGALRDAQAFVRRNRRVFARGSLIPAAMTTKQWMDKMHHLLRQFREDTGLAHPGYHGHRHAYAQRLYADLYEAGHGVRVEAPVKEGRFGKEHIASVAERLGVSPDRAREIDREIRLEVSRNLGHGRVNITRSYLGE
ncbi:MAG: hypothetical protein HPY67_01920 [Syntrophaceae bacterium]|nr:hypothetical protein [Syntrophaceae bacterium]